MTSYPSNSCIVAGLGGDSQGIVFAPIDPLTATGGVTDMISPEYDMRTRVEYTFSSDIYADTGTLYSDEYMSHRQSVKKEFIKQIEVS